MMRSLPFIVLTIGLAGFLESASGQEKAIGPPRLQIRTETDDKAGMKEGKRLQSILKVQAVATAGLGSQLGLNPGDVIKSLKVKDNAPLQIQSTADLSRGLKEVFDVTKDNSNKEAPILLIILQKGKSEKRIEGTIIRTDLFDRVDGSTLYYFRPEKKKQ